MPSPLSQPCATAPRLLFGADEAFSTLMKVSFLGGLSTRVSITAMGLKSSSPWSAEAFASDVDCGGGRRPNFSSLSPPPPSTTPPAVSGGFSSLPLLPPSGFCAPGCLVTLFILFRLYLRSSFFINSSSLPAYFSMTRSTCDSFSGSFVAIRSATRVLYDGGRDGGGVGGERGETGEDSSRGPSTTTAGAADPPPTARSSYSRALADLPSSSANALAVAVVVVVVPGDRKNASEPTLPGAVRDAPPAESTLRGDRNASDDARSTTPPTGNRNDDADPPPPPPPPPAPPAAGPGAPPTSASASDIFLRLSSCEPQSLADLSIAARRTRLRICRVAALLYSSFPPGGRAPPPPPGRRGGGAAEAPPRC